MYSIIIYMSCYYMYVDTFICRHTLHQGQANAEISHFNMLTVSHSYILGGTYTDFFSIQKYIDQSVYYIGEKMAFSFVPNLVFKPIRVSSKLFCGENTIYKFQTQETWLLSMKQKESSLKTRNHKLNQGLHGL